MMDEKLQSLFPSYGDKIAIADFCNKQQNTRRKQSLLDRLRTKLKSNRKKKNALSSSDEEEENIGKRSKSSTVKTNEIKHNMRFIEIGWLHFSQDKQLKQVRTKNGGGTRKIRINKNSTKVDMIEQGKKLFFPNNESANGLQLRKFETN